MLLKKIFNIEKTLSHRRVTVFGVKFGVKDKEPLATVNDIRSHIMASKVNAGLEKYRAINSGKDILIVGSGPSLSFFTPWDGTINVGINRAFLRSDIPFDFLFAQDKFPEDEHMQGFIDYKGRNCKKFFGIHSVDVDYRVRTECISKTENRELYILNNRRRTQFPFDITLEPFAYYAGTVFSAMQFILFTNPKRIFLAGFDCSSGHAFKVSQSEDLSFQYSAWLKIKDFINTFYENVEVISINPVGLKGIFKDFFTQSFVNQHPELLNENIHLLPQEVIR